MHSVCTDEAGNDGAKTGKRKETKQNKTKAAPLPFTHLLSRHFLISFKFSSTTFYIHLSMLLYIATSLPPAAPAAAPPARAPPPAASGSAGDRATRRPAKAPCPPASRAGRGSRCCMGVCGLGGWNAMHAGRFTHKHRVVIAMTPQPQHAPLCAVLVHAGLVLVDHVIPPVPRRRDDGHHHVGAPLQRHLAARGVEHLDSCAWTDVSGGWMA